MPNNPESRPTAFTLDFTSLAKALSRDIESVYCVDFETDAYVGYASDGACALRETGEKGADFFGDCRRDIERIVYSDDRGKVAGALNKETLLAALKVRKSFSMDYRLVTDGKPVYHRMKVIPAEEGDFRRVIVGVSNVDAQITEEQRLAAERQNLQSFSRIAQALAQDYFIIYCVDTETDYFMEFRAEGNFLDYGIEKQGEDFFALSRDNIPLFTVPEDVPGFLQIFTKENILREIEQNGSFSHTYRMLLCGVPTYVIMKATRMDERNIVIGTSNIDSRVKREQAQTRALQRVAQRMSSDELTGVKSKRMFVEIEQQFDARIAAGTETPFAIAVFDLNNLKRINDTQGHAAGDAYIREGSAAICNTFKHSPVYRIGGDEFAAILRGSDYKTRAALLRSFQLENTKSVYAGGAVVACGMADFIPGVDRRFQDTFERADNDMYENKNRLKQMSR